MGHEVKWVGYLGCLTLRVIHFEMGSCFGWRVAERTYTWREDWMGGLEQGFELNDDTEWVGYLGCLEWWDNHFEMALWKCLGVAERTYTVRQHSECGLEQGFEITHDVKWVGWLGRHNLVKHSFWDGFVLLGGESLRGDGLCAARTKQSLGCGRPSEASRDPRVWKATLWIPYGIPCGVPYGVHCGDLGTLGGTLRTPGSSRERLERDSRQSQDSLKTVSTTPKAWIPKSEKSEMRSEPSHRNSSKSSSNKRKSDTKGEGGKWARAWGWSERGRPFSPTHECVECDPLGILWEPLGTPGCGRPSEGSVMSRDMSECMESSE